MACKLKLWHDSDFFQKYILLCCGSPLKNMRQPPVCLSEPRSLYFIPLSPTNDDATDIGVAASAFVELCRSLPPLPHSALPLVVRSTVALGSVAPLRTRSLPPSFARALAD